MTDVSKKSLVQRNNQGTDMTKLEPWMTKTLLIGGGVGALAGLLAAYLLIKNSQESGVTPTINAREGFQIAVLLFGTIRSVARLWEQ
jgi:hypothetical protein